MPGLEGPRHPISGGYTLADVPFRCVEVQVRAGNFDSAAVSKHCKISKEMARLAIQTIRSMSARGAGDLPSS